MDHARSLLRWYRANGREFPWRTATVDPYVVLVSETMLQQTQASRVAEALPRFLERYPSIGSLAKAGNGEIIRQWKGMGYNSRAMRLRDAAKAVVRDHNGVIPSSPEILLSLPGVGPYTSAAVACFAFNKRVVVLDVNVRRVYSRLVKRQTYTTDVEPDEVLIPFATSVIPQRRSAQWHHAVMDLGATICTARAPRCTMCPLADLCPSNDVLLAATRSRKQEPEFRGEPQRIWRGRFIEVLRGQKPHVSIRPARLFTLAAQSPLSSHEEEWFTAVLSRLETDGLIVQTGRGVRLAD
ncbi:MAG: A/G-specific adenine glycosylase [Ignavibacteria bacterium]|nr:A/G-specific adenine glycosylase [Ignavibacteria bacterium]MBL0321960.1 A/G-specific adenine glycosylase [Ignavibacteria bacterium]MBP7092925.1 A/G-specific adenine glycosylase [Candidatus Kapabacteria bacterium]